MTCFQQCFFYRLDYAGKLQMKTTSGEVKANDQDEVIIIDETVESGKVIISQDELVNYKKSVEE